jgi:hypothetical protein
MAGPTFTFFPQYSPGIPQLSAGPMRDLVISHFSRNLSLAWPVSLLHGFRPDTVVFFKHVS